MPIFFFTCEDGHRFNLLRTPKEITKIKKFPCKVCGKAAKRTPKGAAGATVKESIDNTVMPRRVERLAEAERLFKDHNKIIDGKRGGE